MLGELILGRTHDVLLVRTASNGSRSREQSTAELIHIVALARAMHFLRNVSLGSYSSALRRRGGLLSTFHHLRGYTRIHIHETLLLTTRTSLL